MYIIILRMGFLLMLAIAAAILGTLSFVLFRSYETTQLQQQFSSAAELIENSINDGLNTKIYATDEFAKIIAYQVGRNATWPNVTIGGFEQISASHLKIAQARAISFDPLIVESNRRPWEVYAANYMKSLHVPTSVYGSFEESWPVSNGIFMKTSTGVKIYNPYNDTGSIYPQIHVPIWQIAPIVNNSKAIMYNQHSESRRCEALDLSIKSKKVVLTDILQLVQDTYTRPSSILFSPVFDLHSGSNIVGFVSVAFSWDAVIGKTLPSYLHGMYCVLKTASTTFTFSLDGGYVILVGSGDLHDPSFDSSRYSIEFHQEVTTHGTTQGVGSADSITYSFELYPSKEMQEIFYTSRPKFVVVGVVVIVVCVAAVFIAYDYLISMR